jgi:hypothetical protein
MAAKAGAFVGGIQEEGRKVVEIPHFRGEFCGRALAPPNPDSITRWCIFCQR